jgi:ketosteroid isomerase-like protein
VFVVAPSIAARKKKPILESGGKNSFFLSEKKSAKLCSLGGSHSIQGYYTEHMRMETPPWVSTLFQALDAFDAKTFASFLTNDAVFVFGNAEPVRGKQTIHDVVAGFFTSIQAIRHDLLDTWTLPATVICRGVVTYTRHSGTQLSVPFANVFKLRDGLIQDYLIYVDNSQLYTRQ